MKHQILSTCFVLCSFLAISQKKGYADFSFLATALDLKGVGGTMGIGINLASSVLSVGGGVNYVKFRDMEKASPAVFAELRDHFKSKSVDPYFLVDAGSVLYKQKVGFTTASGSFYYGAGLGMAIITKTPIRPFASIKYTNWSYNIGSKQVNYGVALLNIGLEL